MRLTKKKILDILVVIVGEEGLPLVEKLIGKENISEFDLATKLKTDIKIIRKLLYILYNHNLVAFTRKKDKQKGWYIYYWTLLPESIRFSYFKMKRELLERLQQQLEEEERELFFFCPNNCVRMNFDQAADFEFHCPECGKLVNQDEGERKITELKKRIKETEGELKELRKLRKIRRERKIIKKKEVKVRKKKKVAKKKITKKKKKRVKKPAKKKVSRKKKLVTKKKVKKKIRKKRTKPKKKVTKKVKKIKGRVKKKVTPKKKKVVKEKNIRKKRKKKK